MSGAIRTYQLYITSVKKHPLVDITHIQLASQAEVSYSTRALQALRAIRIYVLLGLAPSGTGSGSGKVPDGFNP